MRCRPRMRFSRSQKFSLITNLIIDYQMGLSYKPAVSLDEGPRSRGVPEGGARLGVLRTRLAPAAPGGPWKRRLGTTAQLRGVLATSFGANAGVGSTRTRTKNRQGGAPKGERTMARSAPRLASAAQFAPFGAPPPLIGGSGKEVAKTRVPGAAGTKCLCQNGKLSCG